jgi:hypothetical protein
MFLRPGVAPHETWIPEVVRFVEQAELAGKAEAQAAVFSPGQAGVPGSFGPLHSWFRMRPRPEQGLVIGKRRYDSLGGHRDHTADCEADLLRRLGRGIAVLRTPAIMID